MCGEAKTQSLGAACGERFLHAQSDSARVCLAASVPVGAALNGWFGWWWADPLAGLIIVFYGIREGPSRSAQLSGHASMRLLKSCNIYRL